MTPNKMKDYSATFKNPVLIINTCTFARCTHCCTIKYDPTPWHTCTNIKFHSTAGWHTGPPVSSKELNIITSNTKTKAPDVFIWWIIKRLPRREQRKSRNIWMMKRKLVHLHVGGRLWLTEGAAQILSLKNSEKALNGPKVITAKHIIRGLQVSDNFCRHGGWLRCVFARFAVTLITFVTKNNSASVCLGTIIAPDVWTSLPAEKAYISFSEEKC